MIQCSYLTTYDPDDNAYFKNSVKLPAAYLVIKL